jgi:hypothetical protein
MTKFRKGDIVSFKAVVISTMPDKCAEVEVLDGIHAGMELMMEFKHLKLVEGGPPQPGDTVIMNGDESETFTILAIDGETAWMKRTATGSYSYGLLRNLVVVERA